jgi:hypothetical protein
MSFLGLFSRSHRRRQRARRRLAVTAVTLLGLGAMAVAATAYSRLYVFGESLSEVRNLLAAAGITSSPNNSPGFDGSAPPVWTEDIAAHLGLQANSGTPGGTNTDVGSLPGNLDGVLPDGFSVPSLAAQIAAAGTPDPDGLVVIQGANAGSFAGSFNGATVIASNGIGGFTGPFTSPPEFSGMPVIFGGEPGQQFVPDRECRENCEPIIEDRQPEREPIITALGPCPESECPTQPRTDDNPGGDTPCPGNCSPPTNLPAITAQVPEPATVAVILAGLSLLVLVRQRRPARARRGQP